MKIAVAGTGLCWSVGGHTFGAASFGGGCGCDCGEGLYSRCFQKGLVIFESLYTIRASILPKMLARVCKYVFLWWRDCKFF